VDDIDDIIQEVYLRIVKDCRLKKAESAFAYLCTIASNIVKDQLRKQQVREVKLHVSADEVALKSSSPSPEQSLQSKEVIGVINDAFDTLDKRSQQAIILHRFKGFTYKSISKEMGISITMVRKHIVRALDHITEHIDTYHEKTI